MLLLRLLILLILFIRYRCWFLLGLVFKKNVFWLVSEDKAVKQAICLRRFLQHAGPIFIKLGQILSTRVDLLGETYINELKKLVDSTDIVDFVVIKKSIEANLKLSIDKVFREVSPTVVFSASIAQVHQAYLLNGDKVAIKVVKPKSYKLYNQDLKLLSAIVTIFGSVMPSMEKIRLNTVINNLKRTLKKELDLTQEAGAMATFSEQYANDEEIYIPKVYWKYVYNNMLVQEWIDGVKLADFIADQQIDSITKQHISNILLRSFIVQLFEYGFFHADLHVGNIFILNNRQVCFIDFGVIGTLSIKNRYYLFNLFKAFVEKNHYQAAKIHFLAGWIDSNKYAIDDFALVCRYIVEKVFSGKQKDIIIGDLLKQLFLIARNFEMIIQDELLLVQKNLLYIEHIGRSLNANQNMWVALSEIFNNEFYLYNLKTKISIDTTDLQLQFNNISRFIKHYVNNYHYQVLHKTIYSKILWFALGALLMYLLYKI